MPNIRHKERSTQLTKDDIRLIATQWESKTVRQIAEILDVTTQTIYVISKKMRDAGVNLPKKRQHGVINGLIREVINEM